MKVAIYGVFPFVHSGYGNLTKYLLYYIATEHECTIYAYYGMTNAFMSLPINGPMGKVNINIVGNNTIKSINHEILIEDADKYDVIIGLNDQWAVQMGTDMLKKLYEKNKNIVWWLIVDTEPVSFPTRNAMKYISCGVPTTNWAYNQLIKCKDIDNDKVYDVIPYGVDYNLWHSNISKSNDFNIVTIAPNIGMRECIPLMIEGFYKFVKYYGIDDVTYYIHTDARSDSPSSYNIIDVCKACNDIYDIDLTDKISMKHTKRRLPDVYIKKIYIESSVLLNAVTGNFELPMMEASLCNTPSIGLDFGGPGEILSNNRGIKVKGYPMWMNLISAKQYFPYSDDIAKALKTYYDNEKLRYTHAKNLRKWIIDNALWDIVADKWLELLKYIGD